MVSQERLTKWGDSKRKELDFLTTPTINNSCMMSWFKMVFEMPLDYLQKMRCQIIGVISHG